MKVNHRQFLNSLSESKKRKRTIEWCIAILRQDIDRMPEREFFKFIIEYECLVEYPMTSVGYYSWINDDGERNIKNEFKIFQLSARKIISDFEKMKAEHSQLLKNTKMEFTVLLNRQGIYSFIENNEHDFEYSYTRQIAKALEGKTFGDVFKKCSYCDYYFAILSTHQKGCCSHNCAMLWYNKKKFQEDNIKATMHNRIGSYFSRLKSKGMSDKQIEGPLNKYMNDRKYTSEDIPHYLKKFVKKSKK